MSDQEDRWAADYETARRHGLVRPAVERALDGVDVPEDMRVYMASCRALATAMDIASVRGTAVGVSQASKELRENMAAIFGDPRATQDNDPAAALMDKLGKL